MLVDLQEDWTHNLHLSGGILASLLHPEIPGLLSSPDSKPIEPQFYVLVAQSISALLEIAKDHQGHLPMSIPPWKTERSPPLVQMCHGTPGLLLLVAAALRNTMFVEKYWDSDWDFSPAIQTVRTQGLLSKGLGICHGTSGNALSLLLVADAYREASRSGILPEDLSVEEEVFCSAIRMLLVCGEAPPLIPKESSRFRVPDNPYSLFEGLAGTIWAWVVASDSIKSRLQDLEQGHPSIGDRGKRSNQHKHLGFPGLW
jgi:hypothetical protein